MARTVRAEYNLAKKAFINAQYKMAEANSRLFFANERYAKAIHALIEQENAREKRKYGVA